MGDAARIEQRVAEGLGRCSDTRMLVAAGSPFLLAGQAVRGSSCWRFWWAPVMQEDSVPPAPTPLLDWHETGCGGVMQAVPHLRSQEGTGTTRRSTVAVVLVRSPHGKSSGGYRGALAVYAPR